jgi:hypothetical protein
LAGHITRIIITITRTTIITITVIHPITITTTIIRIIITIISTTIIRTVIHMIIMTTVTNIRTITTRSLTRTEGESIRTFRRARTGSPSPGEAF